MENQAENCYIVHLWENEQSGKEWVGSAQVRKLQSSHLKMFWFKPDDDYIFLQAAANFTAT